MYLFWILIKHRKILYVTSMAEIRSRYGGTFFGLGWAVIYPFLFLALYAVVYDVIFKVRMAHLTSFDYVLMIFAGLIPFIGFSEALGTTVPSVVTNKALLKNLLFPIELVPVKAVITSSVSMLVGLVVLLLTLWVRGNVSLMQLIVVPVFVLQILFTIGVAWLLSCLNVFFRDIGQTIGIVTLFLMMVSPIAYTQDMVPHALRIFMYPNPLFYMMALYRQVLIYHHLPFGLFGIFVAITLVTFLLSGLLFLRLKPLFGEYV